jgi:hypothetical protein
MNCSVCKRHFSLAEVPLGGIKYRFVQPARIEIRGPCPGTCGEQTLLATTSTHHRGRHPDPLMHSLCVVLRETGRASNWSELPSEAVEAASSAT